MRQNYAQMHSAGSVGGLMRTAHIAKLLGGPHVLGRRIGSELDLERCAREGFPLGVLQVSAFPGAKAIYRDFWSGAYREA